MAAEVTRMPQRLSNGVLAEPIPELRAKYARLGGSGEPNSATKHRQFLHAQTELEEMASTMSEVYTKAEHDHEIRQRIQDFASTALAVLEDIITGRLPASLALRAKYAHLHLARAGYGVINKVDATSLNQHLTREDIEAIKQRSIEASNEAKE